MVVTVVSIARSGRVYQGLDAISLSSSSAGFALQKQQISGIHHLLQAAVGKGALVALVVDEGYSLIRKMGVGNGFPAAGKLPGTSQQGFHIFFNCGESFCQKAILLFPKVFRFFLKKWFHSSGAWVSLSQEAGKKASTK